MESIKWERIEQDHAGEIYRVKVPGGWLVKEYQTVVMYTQHNGYEEGRDWRVSMCFVPDPEHKWLMPAEKEMREGCVEFERKESGEQTGDCQTDGHFMCGMCKHIAPFDLMEESDNRMRYYRDQEERERAETEAAIAQKHERENEIQTDPKEHERDGEVCEHCNRGLIYFSGYYKHLSSGKEFKIYQCGICEKTSRGEWIDIKLNTGEETGQNG